MVAIALVPPAAPSHFGVQATLTRSLPRASGQGWGLRATGMKGRPPPNTQVTTILSEDLEAPVCFASVAGLRVGWSSSKLQLRRLEVLPRGIAHRIRTSCSAFNDTDLVMLRCRKKKMLWRS